jgi:hypothetical protein
MKASGLILALLFLCSCAALPTAPWASMDIQAAPEREGDDDLAPEGWEPIRVAVRAATLTDDPNRLENATGALTFKGGLELQSDHPRFGGLSDLHVDDEGRLLAITDQGDWFKARLVSDQAGVLTGLIEPMLARMRGSDGAPFADKQSADAEDLALLPDGRIAVSFERLHLVRIYDLHGKGPAAGPDFTLFPRGTENLAPNESFEALAPLGDGLLIGSEKAPGGPDAGFWITGLDPKVSAPMAGIAPLERRYGLVSLDRLPDGDFLALERFYAPLIGPRIILRRVSAAALAASPARWEATVLADLGPPLSLDNFEGVASLAVSGGVQVYMISDDNFRRQQRTLLYAFSLER